MPKLSVYVADELWDRAKAAATPSGAKTSSSQVVQRAIETMVRERDERTSQIAAGAAIDHGRVADVVARMRLGARKQFEDGYAAALDLIEIIGFDGLGVLVVYLDGDIAEYVEQDPGGSELDGWWTLHDIRVDPSDPYYEAFRDGARRAAADVWSQIRAENWGAGAAADSADEPAPDEAR